MREFFCDLVKDFVANQKTLFPHHSCQFMLVGDTFQMVYGYQGAKLAFFRTPEIAFKGLQANDVWVRKRLTVSYRITHEMARWVNENLDPKSIQFAFPEWYRKSGQWIAEEWGSGIRAAPPREPAPESVEMVRRPWPQLEQAAEELRNLYDIIWYGVDDFAGAGWLH